MRKEDLLIRRLLAHNLKNEPVEEEISKKIGPGINLAYFLEKAKEERVAALLYRLFSQTKQTKDLIPEGVFKRLENTYFWTQRENMLSLKAMEEIIFAFKENNINVISFKGPVLAELTYNDLGLRPMRDWDILIKPQDLRKADRILEKEFNYLKRFQLNPSYVASITSYRNSILYNNITSYPKHIHIYWHLINLLPYNNAVLTKINMERVWQDSTMANLGDIETRVFSVEHHLIYLCLHALNHGYRPLLLLCDINELIRKNKVAWENLTDEAFNFGLSRQVYYGLYLASEILKADIPADVLIRLRPKKQGILEKRFFSSLIKGESAIDDVNTAFFLNLVFNETLQDRIKFTFSALLPPRKDLTLIRQTRENHSLFVHTKRIKAGLTSVGKCLYGLIFN
jgi:hypothetical protein